MSDAFTIAPDPQRALRFDRRMRERLADSLDHIVEAIDGQIPLDLPAFEEFRQRLRGGPIGPLTFGAYYDLVLALDGDDLERAEALLAEIAAAPARRARLAIYPLADPGADAAAERMVRLIDTDPEQAFRAIPAPPDRAAGCQARLETALALIDAGDPDLAAEIRTLVSDVVLAAAPLEKGVMQFEGASSFMLWGAMLLNAGDIWTTLGAAQALAHESGHTLLFGHCIDGRLVENDADARFASPLRTDPRPMEGIFHATYVTARMYRCVAKLLAARVLDRASTQEGTEALSTHRRGFEAGMSVIDAEARLTELGREVIEGARRFMAAPAV